MLRYALLATIRRRDSATVLCSRPLIPPTLSLIEIPAQNPGEVRRNWRSYRVSTFWVLPKLSLICHADAGYPKVGLDSHCIKTLPSGRVVSPAVDPKATFLSCPRARMMTWYSRAYEPTMVLRVTIFWGI